MTDHPTPPHKNKNEQFGVFLSVVIIGAALYYIYGFYRRNYWDNQGGAPGGGAGPGGRRPAVRTAGGRGGQPLLQEEDWL